MASKDDRIYYSVVVEQEGFAGAALNLINGMINSIAKTVVIFSLQTNFLRRNS